MPPNPTRAWSVCHASSAQQLPLPAELASRHSAVVVGEEAGTWVVAVPQVDAGRRDEIARAMRRPVRLIEAPPSDLAVALARCNRGADYHQVRGRHIQTLVHDLGLPHFAEEELARGGTGDSVTEQPDDQLLSRLPATMAAEIRGLVAGIPHLSLRPEDLSPALYLLLPPQLRDPQLRPALGPLWLEDETIVMACSDVPPEEVTRAITAWCGYQVRYVLASAGVLQRAAEQCYESQQEREPLLPPAPRLRRRGQLLITSDALDALASQLKIPVEEAQKRIQPDEYEAVDTPVAEPLADAVDAVPRPLAIALQFVPLRVTSHTLEIALADDRPDARQVADVLTAVTGLLVRIHWVQARSLYVLAAQAHSHPPGVLRPSGSRLPSLEHVPAYQLRAARLGLPSVRVEHCAILPPGETPLGHEHMQILKALPLRRDGRVLMVAVADMGEAIIGDLTEMSGMTIWPVLAEIEAIEDRLTVLDRTGGSIEADRRRAHPVVKALQVRNQLSRSELFRVLIDPHATVDQALDATGAITPEGFADLAATLAGLATINLDLQARDEEGYDPLGRPARRRVWIDPVNEEVARLVSPQTTVEAALLPVQRESGRLVVAVADPFDPATISALHDLRAHHPIVRVTPRPSLTTAIARAGGRIPLGERLIAHGVISPEDLTRALRLHRTAGIRLGQALLNLDLVSEEQLAFFLAEQQDLPFFRLEGMEPDVMVGQMLPEELERSAGLVPLYQFEDRLVIATVDPLNQRALDEVAARTSLQIEPVVCTESDLQFMLEQLYRSRYLEQSVGDLVSRHPEESAARVLTRRQSLVLSGAAVILAALFLFSPITGTVAITGFCSIFYAVFSLYKTYLIYHALSHELEVPITEEDLAELSDANLPVYTILVPLYREASVLPTLLHGLTQLNYPSAKLDAKLLLEEDDYETREAVEAMNLPSYVEPVIVPAAHPRNKPKACNYGLLHARGEYVVIYDAEDIPDPNQLRMAVAAFRKVDERVVCVQAKLNYYNANQNLLTRWFTIEYSMWFDLFLPGLDATSAPIPLGGTSNHFPTQRLRDVGAWDPFNVTEDADLGLRLYRRDGKTAIIDSTTLEEANSEMYNWIRQRSRWVKGYIQTYLVHMRHPVRLWKTIGPKAFFEFQMVIGGTFFSFLINPIFWILTALWYLAHAGFIRAIYPSEVFYLGILSLGVGNFAFIYLNVAGCLRRGYYGMVRYALLIPLYWAMMSIAAWKGFLQLAYKPFYWEKTVHGLYKPEGEIAVDGSGT